MKDLKKKIFGIFLAASLVLSSPMFVLAAEEATPAQEAGTAEGATTAPPASTAPEASPAPEAESSPTSTESSPNPSSSPEITTQSQDPSNQNNWSGSADPDEVSGPEEELTREERIDAYYQYLQDKAEWDAAHSNNVGNTSIDTGDATASGVVTNTANGSVVNTPGCSVCADNVSATNSGNGTNSNNSGAVTTTNTSAVQIENDANINNNLNFEADSGNNTASFNVGDSEIETGDANVSGVLINSANQTGLDVIEYNITEDYMGDVILELPADFWTSCNLCGPSGNLAAENTGNGSDSTNSASIDSTNTETTDIDNTADVVNDFTLTANSGYNDTSYNVGDSQIDTGDANVAANLLNFVNSTVDGGVAFVVNVFGDLIGDIIFPDLASGGASGGGINASNTGNGSGSTNNANLLFNNQSTTDINNLATIDNNLIIDAETGENSTSANTGGSNSIDTGDVFVNAQVLNVANINSLGAGEPLWLLLVNNMGTWTGQIVGALTGQNYTGSEGLVFYVDENGEVLAQNSANGSGSTNDASISQTNTQNTTIDNTANLVNNVNINANTGNNHANNNTGGSSEIKTGDVNVAASIINFVNTNLIGRKLMVGIINVFGSWKGDAVPPGQDPQADESSSSSQESAQGGPTVNLASSGGSLNTSSSPRGTFAALSAAGQNQNNQASSTGESSFFGSSAQQGNSNFALLGDTDSNSSGGGNGLGDSSIGNTLSLRFNWKMLTLALIPIVLFAIIRRLPVRARRQEVYTHKISSK